MVAGPACRSAATHTAMKAPEVPMMRTWPSADASDAHCLEDGGYAADEQGGEHAPGDVAFGLVGDAGYDDDGEDDGGDDYDGRLESRPEGYPEWGIFVRLVSYVWVFGRHGFRCSCGGWSLADGAAEGRCGAAASEEASVAGFLLQFALVVEGLAAEEGHPGLAVYLPALVEGEAGIAVVVFGADNGFAFGVEDGDVGVGADLEGTLLGIDAEDAGGVFGHDAGEPGGGEAASEDAFAEGEGGDGLYAGGAEGHGGSRRG